MHMEEQLLVGGMGGGDEEGYKKPLCVTVN
jgi:hypothetical protein